MSCNTNSFQHSIVKNVMNLISNSCTSETLITFLSEPCSRAIALASAVLVGEISLYNKAHMPTLRILQRIVVVQTLTFEPPFGENGGLIWAWKQKANTGADTNIKRLVGVSIPEKRNLLIDLKRHLGTEVAAVAQWCGKQYTSLCPQDQWWQQNHVMLVWNCC